MKVIKLKTTRNIRDIGGSYSSIRLKEGMFTRGTALLHLSNDDLIALRDVYNVKTIIDLRSTDEQNLEPDMKIEGVNFLSIPVFEREQQGISHTEDEQPQGMDLYRKLPTMDRIYYDMLHGESLENISKTIRYIVNAKDDEYGFYFHCSEGKDRTGLIAAILLLILGVSKKEIMKDYLYTNKVNHKKAFKYYMAIKYLQFSPLFALKVGRTFLAKRKYLNTLFNIIKDEYGGEDNFFKKAMHLTNQEIESFKKRMIVKQKYGFN